MINNGLLDCETVPLDEQTTDIFMNVIFMERANDYEHILSKFEQDPGYAIIKSRLEHAGGSATPPLILFLSHVSKGVPGHMVTWAYTLACIQHKNKLKSVTIEDWAYEFPKGIPVPQAYDKVWDSQKVERTKNTLSSDNGYDDYNNWPAIK